MDAIASTPSYRPPPAARFDAAARRAPESASSFPAMPAAGSAAETKVPARSDTGKGATRSDTNNPPRMPSNGGEKPSAAGGSVQAKGEASGAHAGAAGSAAGTPRAGAADLASAEKNGDKLAEQNKKLFEDINTRSKAGATTPSGIRGKDKDDLQNQFMTMLIEQMKRQDPINPMDSAQMTSQLAQIQSVSGLNQINESVKSLAGVFQAGLTVQAAGLAASLIGRSVMAETDRTQFDGNTPVTLQARVNEGVSGPTMEISGAEGQRVRTLSMTADSSGIATVSWDGKDDSGALLPAGSYVLKATGQDKEGAVAQLSTAAGVRVVSTDLTNNSVSLSLANGKNLPLSAVSMIH